MVVTSARPILLLIVLLLLILFLILIFILLFLFFSFLSLSYLGVLGALAVHLDCHIANGAGPLAKSLVPSRIGEMSRSV